MNTTTEKKSTTNYLTIAEVKNILNISTASAYELARRKDFPTCRFGGSIRIPELALECWVEQHTNMPRTLRQAINERQVRANEKEAV